MTTADDARDAAAALADFADNMRVMRHERAALLLGRILDYIDEADALAAAERIRRDARERELRRRELEVA